MGEPRMTREGWIQVGRTLQPLEVARWHPQATRLQTFQRLTLQEQLVDEAEAYVH